MKKDKKEEFWEKVENMKKDMEKSEKKGFWKKVEKASDWIWEKFQDLLDKIDDKWCKRLGSLYMVLLWPVLFLWILAALARIILLFVAI